MPYAPPDEYLTAQEAADYMGIGLKLVYSRRWLGIGPRSFKRNNRIVFRRSEIDEWLLNEERRTTRGEGV